jgi:hypothetical protein
MEEFDKEEYESEQYCENSEALEEELEAFRLWYNAQYYLYQASEKGDDEVFNEELARRMRKIKELEFKTEVYYYKTMMAIMTPELFVRMWD